MKICYLVIAFNNPNHFQRLSKTLSASPNAIVFVHIDDKSDLSQFQYEASRTNVVFIKQRVAVNWGGFSMVRATLNLLNAAFESGYNFSHFCLLSGSCYPVKSMVQIEQYLQQHHGQNFIHIAQMSKHEPMKNNIDELSRISSYYFDTFFNKNIAYIAHNPCKFALAVMKKIINRLYIQRDYKPIFAGLTPYAGSSWWILSDDAVRYIMQFATSRPKFVQFFQNTRHPDENFFHTIIGNSNFTHQRSRTFTDWSGKHSPCKPAIINNTLIDICKNTQSLFARKFPDNSTELVDVIQKNVWDKSKI